MKDFNSAFCIIDVVHFDETISFGAVCGSVVDDFYFFNVPDTFEEVFYFVFRSFEGEIS